MRLILILSALFIASCASTAPETATVNVEPRQTARERFLGRCEPPACHTEERGDRRTSTNEPAATGPR